MQTNDYYMVSIHGYIGCLNIRGYKGCVSINGYIGCLNIHGTHVTSNNSPNNNVVFIFVLVLKMVFYNGY